MTYLPVRAVALTSALAFVSACSGGASDLIGGAAAAQALDPSSSDRLSFSEIADIASDVNDGYNAVRITPKAQVPTAGRADYYGPVGGTIDVARNSTRVGGLMGLAVDFGQNRVGGTVGNFVTSGGAPIAGTLSVNSGVLNRQSNSQQVAIFADVDGTLRSASGERIVVDARLRESGFKGSNAQFVGGSIEGPVRVDGALGSIDLRAQLER